MERNWKFSMTRQHGPMWDLYENDKLVAYARRAEKGGWLVQISELYPEKLHVEDGTSIINFMNIMLELHKKETP
jgi:hypothetical protein